MQRRQFLQSLISLGLCPTLGHGFSSTPDNLYQLPERGQARLLHFTDVHAQLHPLYYREPHSNIGVGKEKGLPPHLTGQAFLNFFGLHPHSRHAYAFSDLNFVEAAKTYGKMGGMAYLATLIHQLRQQSGEENTLLLDGGDSWQGSATALWTQGQDMLKLANLLGVDAMTGHWEFTYGVEHLKKNIAQFKGEFIAQNISLTEEAQFNQDTDQAEVFKPYIIKSLKNARIAVIGQAFPYTPIANPQRFTPDWQFGIQEQRLQTIINDIQQHKKAEVIVLLSHNGMDVDLKLASRVNGLDIILGGHTHDAIPKPLLINKTWVTNAGSHGKFLAVVDLDIKQGKLKQCHYQLLPVFSNLLAPDKKVQTFIEATRKPYLATLRKPLAITDKLLYRRDNFQGSFDEILLTALRTVNNAEISFSPGFRWGASLLPHQTLYFEDVMNHTAITYPNSYTQLLSGEKIKAILEDVADNLFNRDPYYRQGGDMVRVGGMRYNINPEAKIGQRISALRLLNGQLLMASKNYKVSGWASVNTQATGSPIWKVATDYLVT
ncbi:MAG: thiosulfohydrolase SoxB [Methylococcales bacterium]|nr:thiosulfohydrolase SoxB [Methylococcales bacterium]